MWFTGFWGIPLDICDMGKSTRKKLINMKNEVTFQNTFSRLLLDALQRYRFTGLPDTINERVLLQSLCWYGCACIYERGDNLFALPCAPSGAGVNMYGDFGSAWVFSLNGQANEEVRLYIEGQEDSAFVKKTNGAITGKARGVMLRENHIMYPFVRTTIQFAEAIADAYRTLDVVRANIKRPYIITAEESVVNSVKKYFEQREQNFDHIISSGAFDPSKIVMVPIDVNGHSLDDATSLIEWYENHYREMCGLKNNSQIDKKGENLISEEVTVNDQYTGAQADRVVETIQHHLDICNKFFGCNIHVERAVEEEEGVNDENVSGDRTDNNIPGNGGRGASADNI